MKESPMDLRPMGIGDIVDKCFRLYHANFLKFILIAAIPQVVLFFISGAWQYVTFSIMTMGTPKPDTAMPVFVLSSIGGLLLLIPAWCLYLVGTGALAYAVSERYLGNSIDVKASYIYVLKKFWRLLGTLLLTGLMIFFGFFFCLLPGIFLMMLFIFTTQAVVLEQCRVTEAISRSASLAWDWRNLLKILVIGLLYFILSLAVGGIATVPFMIVNMLRAQHALLPTFELQILQTAAQSISNIIVSPIFMISFTLLYYDIRIRKEGFDLQVMAENLGHES
jgi:hypothetical protein